MKSKQNNQGGVSTRKRRDPFLRNLQETHWSFFPRPALPAKLFGLHSFLFFFFFFGSNNCSSYINTHKIGLDTSLPFSCCLGIPWSSWHPGCGSHLFFIYTLTHESLHCTSFYEKKKNLCFFNLRCACIHYGTWIWGQGANPRLCSSIQGH